MKRIKNNIVSIINTLNHIEMPFYTNLCSPSFQINDSQTEFYRKFIFYVILCQILIVIALRIFSVFNNHILNSNQNELHEKKEKQVRITQTMTSPQTEVTLPVNLKLSKFKSTKQFNQQRFIHISPSSHEQQNIESIALRKENTYGETQNILKDKYEKKSKPYPTIKQQSKKMKNESFHTDETKLNSAQNRQQTNQYAPGENNLKCQNIKNQSNIFINICNLSLSQYTASSLFSILLGHFFVAATLTMHHSPSFTSIIFAGSHLFLLVLLLMATFFINEKDKKIKNTKDQGTLRNNVTLQSPHQQSLTQNMNKKQVLSPEEVNKNKKLNMRSCKITVFYSIAGLMFIINLCLLMSSVIRIKQSYYNIINGRCE